MISNLNFYLRIICWNSRFICVAYSLKESNSSNRNAGVSMILRILESLSCSIGNNADITNKLRSFISISSFTDSSLTSKRGNIDNSSKIRPWRKIKENKRRTTTGLSKLSFTTTEHPQNSISNRISSNWGLNNSYVHSWMTPIILKPHKTWNPNPLSSLTQFLWSSSWRS